MDYGKFAIRAGGAISGIGGALFALGIFRSYSLAGDCPQGMADCHAYTTWKHLLIGGLLLLVAGITVSALGLLKGGRR